MTAGEKLRAARERKGLTQREIARLIGVSQPAIHRWEAGGIVSAKRLRAVAEVYGLRPQELLPEAV